jgi:hypothetical protein
MSVLLELEDISAEEVMLRAYARRKAQQQEEEMARAKQVESSTSGEEDKRRVRIATATPWHWLRNHTKTKNPHWQEEGCASPYEPFPDNPYFEPMLDLIHDQEISMLEKSRDMMATWAIVGYFTWQAMLVPSRECVFQTLEGTKAIELIDYAKCLYDNQPLWLREAFPLVKPSDKQASDTLAFKNGGVVFAVPGGADKLRSYHPWGYFNDETSFQPDAGQCFSDALGMGAQKIVLNSSAGIGWYSDVRRDADTV